MRKTLILSMLITISATAQTLTDTLTFMHYNVLNYRNYSTYCTTSNNNHATKESHMNTIVGYLLPDIITVNEMAGDGISPTRLLDNGINQGGRKFYKQCAYSANSNLCNMLYYNENKLSLHNQDKIDRASNGTFLVRQIDIYTLYYRDQSQLEQGDTTFLTVYVAHLKAGNTAADATERATMTNALMAYHNEHYNVNHTYLMSGDFNVYTSNEQAFVKLLGDANTATRFKDPINKPGAWNNTGTYASIHTQSTRVTGSCHSGGGLDDRFDFILCGQELLNNARGLGYVNGSYKAVGNDGNHFNADINAGSNVSVPSSVLAALYGMSDHLPVTLKMEITRTTLAVAEKHIDNYLVLNNPVTNQLFWKMQVPQSGTLKITDIQGKEVLVYILTAGTDWITHDVSDWEAGSYYAYFLGQNGDVLRRKLIKI